MFCSDSSVRFATSLLFDVALNNLAGFQVFYVTFLKCVSSIEILKKDQNDVKCSVTRHSGREFCSCHMQLREISTHSTLTDKKPDTILWSIKNEFRNMLTSGQQDVVKSFSRSLRGMNSACYCIVCSTCISLQLIERSQFFFGLSFISCHWLGLTLVSCLPFQLSFHTDTGTSEHVLSLMAQEIWVFLHP